MESAQSKGSCLCGGVTLTLARSNREIGVCHCRMCRKWVGGPFFAVECEEAVEISGDELLGVYASSEWAERVFCRTCGSALFYRLKAGGMIAVSAGLFDTADLRVAQQIFIDEKPAYYELANDTPRLTGEEVFAAFAAKGESPT
ncbi:MAG: GFA family protein [Microvirga sp.]|nr:GFA family protein [Microvirga sp.]